MQTEAENNKRIAKNTAFLYVRMLITLGVSLFTVRVILKTLGAEDYGVYSVVAGFVTSFSFIANTTATAIQRFLSFCLGQDRPDEYRRYFSNSFLLFIVLSLLAVVVLETAGMWFMREKMVIPPSRLDAAVWIYHSAMINLCFSFLSVPYNAVILSHERMNVFAYLSISDVACKLLIAYLLPLLPFDHLKSYAVLLSIIGVTNFVLFRHFARRTNREIRVSLHFETTYLKRLIGFTGWNLIGSLSGLCRNQGVNVLVNLFFGPLYNAACGIAFQMYNAVNGFASNFIMAVNPQIVKQYAAGQKEELGMLVERSSKMAFSLLMLVAFPLLTLMPEILDLWLKEPPAVTTTFARLVLANMLIECVSLPLLTLAQATGKIKLYQTVVGGTVILSLPVSWSCMKYLHAEAWTVFAVLTAANIATLAFRLAILRKTAGLDVRSFAANVLSRWGTMALLVGAGYGLCAFLELPGRIALSAFYTLALMPAGVLFFVFNRTERNSIIQFVKHKLKK